jgi:sigma-E factor negative regulatory protein RseA
MEDHKVSVFMDGELSGAEWDNMVSSLKNDPDARDRWLIYHMISDAMHGTAPDPSGRLLNKFSQRLAQEPTVLTPHRLFNPKKFFNFNRPLIAMSFAASVAVGATVAWLTLQAFDESSSFRIIALNDPEPTNVAYESIASYIHPYLVAHQEYSVSTATGDLQPYIQPAVLIQPHQ